MARKINVKYVVRDSSANLIKNNDVMPIGVISYETDTNKVKLSDGEKSYNNLPYVSSDSSSLNMDYSQLLGKPQINSVELSGNKSLDDLGIAAKNAVYTKEEVDAKVTSVYKFKGSVANEASLPSEGNVIGDVYNVEDTGANFAWDGSKWDNLGMSVDLTPYLTKEEAGTTYATKVELGNKADKTTSLAGYGIADAYTKTEVDSALANKADKSTTYTKDEVNEELANKANVEDLVDNVKYKSFEYNGETRKTIELKNYDSISGLKIDGGGVNLAMVSKWDVADFSSSNVHTNLNTKDNITINDEGIVATIADIEKSIEPKADISYVDENIAKKADTSALALKADKADTYTKSEVDGKLANKADTSALSSYATTESMNSELANKADTSALDGKANKSTTLNGYGITDAYTKSEIDGKLTGALADYALKSELPEVPEKLPNPEALTVTVNNKAFVTYDGSAAITQNLVMNAETIPLNADTTLTVAYGLEEVTPMFIQIPLRTLQDKVYEQETIIGWFGQKDIASIKQKLVKNVPVFVKYGIALSGNPHYYKFPAEYCAFESANQIKLVFQGLNTNDDVVSKYEILINLDGTIIEGNSNVKITITSLEVDASTINYNELNNKPQINSIELSGNKSLDDLGIQPKGEYLTSASIANKADKATTLAGYGITDAYTKDETISIEDYNQFNYTMYGNIDWNKYKEQAYVMQILKSLEQSYIDDLGKPENINGKPYDESSNNYTLGNSYVCFGGFDESFIFHYDLWGMESGQERNDCGQIVTSIADALPSDDVLMKGKAPSVTDIDKGSVTEVSALIDSLNAILAQLRTRGVIA